MLDVYTKCSKKYYPQPFLEECKYEIKKRLKLKWKSLLMII